MSAKTALGSETSSILIQMMDRSKALLAENRSVKVKAAKAEKMLNEMQDEVCCPSAWAAYYFIVACTVRQGVSSVSVSSVQPKCMRKNKGSQCPCGHWFCAAMMIFPNDAAQLAYRGNLHCIGEPRVQ